jgi:hypothetical protein
MTMRRRVGVGAAFLLAVLTASAPGAYAGAGMGAGTGTTTCRLILNAVNQPQTVNVTDQWPVNSPDTVKVGAATLLCDISATGQTVSGPDTTPLPTTVTPNAATCYAVGEADQTKINATILDAFGQQTAKLGGMQFLCVPSVVTFP